MTYTEMIKTHNNWKNVKNREKKLLRISDERNKCAFGIEWTARL